MTSMLVMIEAPILLYINEKGEGFWWGEAVITILPFLKPLHG